MCIRDRGLRNALIRYSPKGQVDTLNASWQGAATAPVTYSAKGRLSQLELAAVDGAPGVRGLNLDFDLDQSAGRATLSMTNGSVDVPGIFQEGLISIDQMSAIAKWQTVQDHIAVQLTGLKFANADTQGEAQIKWQTSDPKKSPSKSRFPGLLDLQAKLSRAEGRRVHRYLPLVIDQRARDYVREAVLDGNASNVRFVVKGDIYDIPAVDARRARTITDDRHNGMMCLNTMRQGDAPINCTAAMKSACRMVRVSARASRA